MIRALTRPVGVRYCFRAFSGRSPYVTNRLCGIALTATSFKTLTRLAPNHQVFSPLNVLGCYPHSSHWRMSEVVRARSRMGGDSIHMVAQWPGCISQRHFTGNTDTGSSSSPHDRNTSIVKYALALLFLCTSGFYSIWPYIKDSFEGSENWDVLKLPLSLVRILGQFFTVNAAKPLVDDDYGKSDVNQGAKNKSDQGMSRRQRFNFIADVLESVESAVVCIEVKDHTTTSWLGMPQASSNGSGFIVKENGLILTNAHVVASQQRNSITVLKNAPHIDLMEHEIFKF